MQMVEKQYKKEKYTLTRPQPIIFTGSSASITCTPDDVLGWHMLLKNITPVRERELKRDFIEYKFLLDFRGCY